MKPDLVAPGGHVWGFMATYQKIAVDHPTFMNSGDFFTMSGTSQAAAVVSGVAALVINNNHGLTPDQVKCRIIASGKPAVNADGQLAYSVLQQGSGLVDAKAAVYGTANNCANQGLNIAADLAGTQHFMGRVRSCRWHFHGHDSERPPLGPGLTCGKQAICGMRLSVGRGLPVEESYLWPEGSCGRSTRTSRDIPWVGGYPSSIGTAASTTSPMSVNAWVAPE